MANRSSKLWLGALALACGCQGVVTPTVGGSTTPRIVQSLPRGGTTVASIRTLPNASCALRIAGQTDATQKLHLYSDDDGMVRIHLAHSDATVDRGDLTLDCTDEAGRAESRIIEVVVSDQATSQAAAAFSVANRPRLPVLDVDPMSLSNADLVARKYPPRPDAVANPDGYAKWLELVQSGPAVVDAHVIVDPDRGHGPVKTNGNGTSNNWSGYVITTPNEASEFAWIYGEWTVPRAYAESGFWHSHHSTLWVGIDGWGTPDVVQDGTDQDTLTAFWIQTSSYDAWTEWYPYSSQTVSNFPVSPGDDIHAWTWVRNAQGNWDPNGNVGWFYLWNATQHVYTMSSTVAPSGIKLGGHTAEWVMERPTVNGSLAMLAQYQSPANITGALAYDLNGRAHHYTDDNSTNVTMMNGSTVLSKVAPVDANTMAFTWVNHQ